MLFLRTWITLLAICLATVVCGEDVEPRLNKAIVDHVLEMTDLAYFPRVVLRDINLNEDSTDWWHSEVLAEDHASIGSLLHQVRSKLHGSERKKRSVITDYICFELVLPEISGVRRKDEVVDQDNGVQRDVSARLVFPSEMKGRWTVKGEVDEENVIPDIREQLSKESVCSIHERLSFALVKWTGGGDVNKVGLAESVRKVLNEHPIQIQIVAVYRRQKDQGGWTNPEYLRINVEKRGDEWVAVK